MNKTGLCAAVLALSLAAAASSLPRTCRDGNQVGDGWRFSFRATPIGARSTGGTEVFCRFLSRRLMRGDGAVPCGVCAGHRIACVCGGRWAFHRKPASSSP